MLNNKIHKRLAIIISIILISSALFPAGKVAVVTKTLGKVEMARGNSSDYSALKSGTILENGDWIRTGATGFASVIFIDDKSVLKVKENTQMEITGVREQTSISKKINMGSGTLRAQINKQRSGDFIIQTPTSVASVKGTDFWLISDPDSGDQVIGLSGLISLFNMVSGMSMNVTAGLTGTSTNTGTINVVQTNPDDVPEDPVDTQSEAESSILRIHVKDENGVEKIIVIEYQ